MRSEVGLYVYVVVPLWKIFSPLFLPVATAAIGFSCLQSLQSRRTESSILQVAQACNACAALLSTGILFTTTGLAQDRCF